MKYITKREKCEPLSQWAEELEEAADPNLGFRHPGFPRDAVKAALLDDQGNLCAYTMQRISINACHIEHIKPQCVCRDEDRGCQEQGVRPQLEEIAWANLLACFPAPLKKGQLEPGYGARKRGSWWSTDQFLSPLSPKCEERIKFSWDGKIVEADPSFLDAATTIKKMNLVHDSLKEQRESAIKKMGLHPLSENPLPPEEAKELAESKWKERLDTGFIEFCVALRDAAKEYLKSIERQMEFSVD